MDKSSIQRLLREGIAAAKLAQEKPASVEAAPSRQIRRLSAAQVSHRERARELLLRVTELDEQNISAWLWLSTVMDSLEEKQVCLENVLILDPNNKHARAGLARLQQTAPASTTEAEPSQPPASEPPVRSKYTRLKPKTGARTRPDPIENAAVARSAPSDRARPTTPPCPFCRQAISTIDKSCPHCELPLIMKCPDCQTAVDVEVAACSECGRSMGNYRRPLDYFVQLGTVYLENRRYQEALQSWQAVERLQPDDPQVRVRLGEAHLGLGRPDRAWDSLQQALQQNPHDASVHFALGEIVRQRGEREQAFKHYHRVIQLDPEHGLAWFQLGRIYLVIRNRKEATKAFRRAIKLLPAGSAEQRAAEADLAQLSPSLPESMATGWSELIRQMTGPVVLCVLAALLDAGLRPWWVPLSGWLALMLAVSGTWLYVSGTDLPRNPIMRFVAGERGLSSAELKITLALIGAFLWLCGLALILLPLGQSYPEPPSL